MEALDKIDFAKYDSHKLISQIEDFPKLCRLAYQLSDDHVIPSYFIKVNKIVLVGMGASGVANDIFKSVLSETTDLIVESIHDYSLPGYTDKDTLVIATSFSGNTEETLSAFINAYEKGARLLAITTGGKLKLLAEKYRAPSFHFDFQGPPRAAFPYLFIFLAAIFSKLGYIELDKNGFLETMKIVEEYLIKIEAANSLFSNPAKILAQRIHGKIPVIYSTAKLGGIGKRLKTQINENAKNFAFTEEIPEVNHNGIEGLSYPREMVAIVMLESNFEFDRNILRQNLTSSLLSNEKISLERIKFVQAKSRFAEILLFVLFGDFVSYYLGILNKVHPETNNRIDFIKKRL